MTLLEFGSGRSVSSALSSRSAVSAPTLSSSPTFCTTTDQTAAFAGSAVGLHSLRMARAAPKHRSRNELAHAERRGRNRRSPAPRIRGGNSASDRELSRGREGAVNNRTSKAPLRTPLTA